jgi:hypothetical protein
MCRVRPRGRHWFVLLVPLLVGGCGGPNIVIGHTPTPTSTPTAKPTITPTPLTSQAGLRRAPASVGVTTVTVS